MSDARSPVPAPLDLLVSVADRLAGAVDLDAVLGAVLADSVAAVGAAHAAIAVQDPDRPELELAAVAGMDEATIEAARASLREPGNPAADAVQSRRAGWLPSGGGDGRADIPLVVSRDGGERTVGVLSLAWNAPHEVDGPTRRLLGAVANLVGLAVDRALLASLAAERAEWFERVAHTDPLTGLANERTFGRVLELELARAGRQGGELSVLAVDVDGFRAINERAGHEAGDDVLRGVAAALAESVRLVDTVARSSGDQFLVLAPGPSGLTVARRILAAVAALPAAADDTPSVSIGVARAPADGASADEVLRAARDALETARSSGPGTVAEAAGQPAG